MEKLDIHRNKLFPLFMRFVKHQNLMFAPLLNSHYNSIVSSGHLYNFNCAIFHYFFPSLEYQKICRKWNLLWQYYIFVVLDFKRIADNIIRLNTRRNYHFNIPKLLYLETPIFSSFERFVKPLTKTTSQNDELLVCQVVLSKSLDQFVQKDV